MSDEQTTGGYTPEEFIRIKHEINKSIKYGYLHAKEYEEFKQLSVDDYSRIRQECAEKHKMWRWSGGDVWNGALFLIGLLLLFFGNWVQYLGVAIMLAATLSFGRWFGQAEGYVDGYEAGFSDGIDKSFGVDKQKLSEISDKSIEIQIEERMISRFDEKKRPGKAKQ